MCQTLTLSSHTQNYIHTIVIQNDYVQSNIQIFTLPSNSPPTSCLVSLQTDVPSAQDSLFFDGLSRAPQLSILLSSCVCRAPFNSPSTVGVLSKTPSFKWPSSLGVWSKTLLLSSSFCDGYYRTNLYFLSHICSAPIKVHKNITCYYLNRIN